MPSGRFYRGSGRLCVAVLDQVSANERPVSEPGQPPSSHTGLLKKFIFFAYEPSKQSVIIGPARLNKTTGDALPALEYGGRTKIVARRHRRRKVHTVNIQARPFMGPAFEREKPILPALWTGSIKK